MKTKIGKNPSIRFVVAVSGATATGQRDTIRAQNQSGNFLCVKTAATLAGLVFIGLIFNRWHYALPKFSASAIALRIAMDLLTVS